MSLIRQHVLLQSDSSFRFPVELPAALNHLIGHEEFMNSMQRCNAACQRGAFGLAAVGLAIGGGIAALITSLLMLGDASLLNVYLTLAFGCVSLVGTVLYRVDRSLRRERLKSAVVAEDAHYNGPTRAAQLHSPPPLRWTVGTAHGNCEEGVSILIIL